MSANDSDSGSGSLSDSVNNGMTEADHKGEFLVDAFINGAQHLKTMLYILNYMNQFIGLVFCKDGINSEIINGTGRILVKISIPEKKILEYDFLTSDDSLIMACVNTTDIESVLKLCKKNMHIKLTIYKGDNKLCFQTVSESDGGSGISVINTKSIDYKKWPVVDFSANVPIKVIATEFSVAIKKAQQSKASDIKLYFYKKGMELVGCNESNKRVTITTFGKCDQPRVPEGSSVDDLVMKMYGKNSKPVLAKAEYNLISIPMKEIKSLTRLGGVSTESSMIEITYDFVEGVKIVGNIGCFGEYEIYIKKL